MDRIISTAVIGLGNSAKHFHIPFLEVSPHYHLKTIAKRSAPTEDQRKAYPHVAFTSGVDAVMQDEGIDLIVITTPNTSHYSLCRQALEHGKHVIVEKPIAVTSEEAMALHRMAKEKRLTLAVYHNRRWDGDFLTVKRLIEEDKLGKLISYESRFDRYREELRPQAWREQALPGSGVLYDIGSHLIDQALYLFGMPRSVRADVRCERGGAVDDAFDITLGYPEVSVTLRAGMLVKEATPRFTVEGERTTYQKYGLDPQENALKEGQLPSGAGWGQEPKERWGTLECSDDTHAIETEAGDYMAYYDDVYEAIKWGKQPSVTAKQAVDVIRIIECALESGKQGERITII